MTVSINRREPLLKCKPNFDIEDTNPLAQIFRGRVVAPDPSLPKSLDRALGWVKNCNNCHTCVPSSIDIPFPTRLLDVGNSSSDVIRLWESNGACGFYTTLSYVWGKTQQLTTTTARYKNHQAGIPFKCFPKTMQDAFIITRNLGIRYIWIDALCIIQDDGQDWQREAAQMGSVYANSYLTISAASASDNSEGCFILRSPPKYATFNYTAYDQSHGELSIFSIAVEKETDRMTALFMREEPISDRGWCFQERVLSGRTLFYANDQMYFECKERFLSEDGVCMEGRIFAIDQSSKAISQPTNTDTMHGLWEELIEGYSSRRLTKSADKLPAMSGLAAKFAQILGDRYLAGLWESTIFVDLLWTGCYSATWPPGKYRAPSWSWAAVDGYQRPFERYGQLDMSQFMRLASIISTSVQTIGLNPYGEVDDGKIVIQAPLVPVTAIRDLASDPEHIRENHGYFAFKTQSGQQLHYGLLDYTINYETLRSLQIFALLMGRDAVIASYPSLLVILDTLGVRASCCYRRIGFIRLQESILGAEIPRWGDRYPIITLV
jgi:heterokaryon incompatibility protein (HET)